MSQVDSPLSNRGKPRWSVAGHLVEWPASMAALPVCSAIVFVGPPLFARAASFGLPVISRPQPALPDCRLGSELATATSQSLPDERSAMIRLWAVTPPAPEIP